MKLEIYRGDIILPGDGRAIFEDRTSGINHVGVIDVDTSTILCVTGPAGDPESEALARRAKAMFEFCEPFAVEFMEQAAEARAKRRIENFINTGRAT